MRVGSLFSGIGGFDLGLERAGGEIVWQCEIERGARRVLAQHWPGVTCFGDVRGVDDVADVDVLVGGFPCQDVSLAGNRAGLAGERSGLFHQFIRLAGAITPRWLVIENVTGLLSSQRGRDMGTVLGCLADCGYGWAYRVLNAQYFGVAQRRRRVFIVGCAGDAARAASVLFEPQSCDGDTAPIREPGASVAALTANGAGASGPDDNQGAAGHLIGFHLTQDPISSNGFTPALGATSEGMAVAIAENQRGEIVETDYAHAVTAGGGKPGQGYAAVRDGYAVRRLTPRECERLQGFPDDWTAALGDMARYRVLGNAVAVPCAEWIGKRLALA